MRKSQAATTAPAKLEAKDLGPSGLGFGFQRHCQEAKEAAAPAAPKEEPRTVWDFHVYA